MTKEDKDLVYKDICARLPYDVIVHVNDVSLREHDTILYEETLARFGNNQAIIRPYLRPMSSMTEEEHTYWDYVSSDSGWGITEGLISECVDWLNAHHFDHRGLIERGLAIAVTEENNPYK